MDQKPCLFCGIVRKEIPARIVYENGEVLAFLDIAPRAPGHTVVIPKVHARTLVDLSDAASEALIRGVKKVSSRLLDVLGADGLTIGINHGPAGGQEVDHVHVHLMPRFTGDGGYSVQSVVANHPKESLESFQQKLQFND